MERSNAITAGVLALTLACSLVASAIGAAGREADLVSPDVYFHEGPVDENGCHKDERGYYHCH